MGTKFYIATSNKAIKDKYFTNDDYHLTDKPTWGYELFMAKTSVGWLPLFQKHNCIQSVKDIEKLYDTGHFIIYDEYGKIYRWNEFVERVVKFNGGFNGAIPKEHHKTDKNTQFYDPDMPDYTPVSHFEYGNGKYADLYSKDEEGYEFMKRNFT